MMWKSYLLGLATFLLLVFVRSEESTKPRAAAAAAARSGGEAVAELEIGPHSNPSSLVKIFNGDMLRARTPLSPAITMELKGMRLLLRSNFAQKTNDS